MTPILLIVFGMILIGFTIWNIRHEEADMLFWTNFLWWNVNKTKNPLLYRIAIVAQFSMALVIIAIGIIWLVYFQ